MRILFDKNVPIGVRRFLAGHEVSTFVDTGWDLRLENGELLKAAQSSGFDVMVTSDQNIRYQQNLKERPLALVVLGSNIWPIVREHRAEILAKIEAATHGSFEFIEMPLPPKRPLTPPDTSGSRPPATAPLPAHPASPGSRSAAAATA